MRDGNLTKLIDSKTLPATSSPKSQNVKVRSRGVDLFDDGVRKR